MIIRHLSIDCAYINKVLEPITQREHGVTEFEIELKNHGADIDLSECTLAIYYGLKPDEHKVGVECRVDKDKGLIYLPLYLQMTTAEGVLKGIVELQFPEGNVRFSGINFKVSFAPDDTKIESTDDFNILENFISKPTTDGVVGQVLSIDNDGNTIWRTLKEFDGDYAHLDNKPSINGVELNGDKSLEDLNIKQTYTADDIPFADGETFQQKFNNGELKGQNGLSAYEIAKNGGFIGTEEEWLKSLKGADGAKGEQGEQGIQGAQGIQGEKGDQGIQGEKGKDGADGKTPVKGIDYFTAEDKTEFTAEVTKSFENKITNKADLITTYNIFDFNIWAKGLQSLTNPVYRGTLDNVDYTEKSFTLTATEPRAYTNGWTSSVPQSMRIAVKPNTKYIFSWLSSSTNCGAYVFLNGSNTAATRFELREGFGSFTTAENTTYIMVRFDYDRTGFFKVSEIMITEKESIYLPHKVAEGVPEIANKVSAFKKTTQEVEDIKAYIGYTDEDIVGLCVDYENKTFTRLAGVVGLSQGADFDKFTMYGGRKRCNVSDDGTITAYYGDESYAEDGSNGQVMVYQPAFYYKVVPLKLEKNTDSGIGYHLRKANYYVSSKPKTGFKLHPAFFDENGNEVEYILLSAYEGSIYDTSANAYLMNDEQVMDASADKFCSIAGVKPASGLTQSLTRQNIEQMAQNRGTGWHCDLIKAESANQLLMIIEMGMMNLQTAIGQGVVNILDNSAYNCSSLTGSTAALGDTTGQATQTINTKGDVSTTETTSGKVSITYRGLENPWGNIWKVMEGINIYGNGNMSAGQPFICDDFNFADSKNNDNYIGAGFTITNANGFVSAMGYSSNCDWLFIASECLGNSSLPVGDYIFGLQNLNGYRIAQLGGRWDDGSSVGAFYLNSYSGNNIRNRTLSGRLLYVPTAKV